MTIAKHTTARMQKGGDLYRAPKTRAEMLAPLSYGEKQQARVRRFGILADGTTGWELIK